MKYTSADKQRNDSSIKLLCILLIKEKERW